MRTLRRFRAPLGVFLTLLVALWQIASPFSASAASFYWDLNLSNPGAGGAVVSGTWGSSFINWNTDPGGTSVGTLWNNTGGHTAVFSSGTDATGVSTITINQGGSIQAGSLVVEEGTVIISGNTAADKLDFSTATGDAGIINVGFGSSLTVNAEITGSSGLGKTGNGSLILTNNANSYTGQTTVNAGTLVVTNQGQLGTSTSAVSVGGVSGFGFTGGTLWLQSGLNGMTFNRDITLSGRGPNTVGGALVLSGTNMVLNGSLGFTSTTETRMVSIYGTNTINGLVQIGANVGTPIGGGGNLVINGQIIGGNEAQDRFAKFSGVLASTLVLNNNNNTFLGGIRIDGSASVQVAQNGALGNSTLIQAVDLNGGMLEVRTDAPDFTSRHVRARGTTSTLYVDRAVGGSGFDETVSFGGLRLEANATLNVIGRTGYDVTFTIPTGTIPWINGGNTTINNSGNGLLRLNGSIERANETTARTLTFGGNGDILMTGNVLQVGTGAVSLTKTGQGTFWLQGGASTATGNTQISQGTLAINRFGGLTTGQLLIGNATTTAGILQYLGATGTGAGETTNKAIVLNTTTANVVILADQVGSATSALVLTGPITSLGGAADAKTLYLGGINEDNNEVRTAIPASAGTLNLAKVGSGTWMLSGANLYTGSTTIANGTLKLLATDANTAAGVSNVIGGGAVIFNVDALTNRQTAGGLLEYIGHASGPSTETLGALTATAGAGTVQVTHGGGATGLVFGSLGTIAPGTGVNFVVGNAADSISITGTSGFVNAHLYYNGADFAYSDAGVLRAPVYGTDAGFVTSASALTATSHNEITGSFGTAGMTIGSLKINGGHTLTLNLGETLTIQTAANSAGGILVTGGNAVISGGAGITTGGSGDLVVRVNGASDSLTLASLITSSTTGGLTKNGAGTLLLEGLQAYTGTTTINEGSIVLSNGGRLGGSVNNGLTIRQDGTLNLNGISVGVGAFNGAGLVTNTSATGATLTIGNNNQVGLFSGLITGNLGVTKVGTGTTMSLTGLNTYTGVTTISGGVLVVNNLADIGQASGIGAGDATSNATNAASLVFNGGTLQYTGANTQIFQQTNTPSISINRLFTLAGNGTIDSTGTFGNSALAGSSNHAALVFNNTGDVAFTGTGNRTLTLTGTSVGWNTMMVHLIDNPNGGLLNLTKSGTGLWVLDPASNNTYTGATTITGGALQAVDGVGLSSGSNLHLNGGVYQTSGTFTRSLGTGAGQVQLTTGNGGFSAGDSGRLVVSIGGVGTPTNLVWGTGGFFTSGSTLILNSTSSLYDVEVVNNIDLGGATRNILVENNGNTHMDFATLSGVISGTGGINKQGSSYLVLGDNNTYTGNTLIDNGALVVTSIGAAGDTATSLGTNVSGGVLNMGAGGNTVNLIYTGSGETVTRTINLIGTTGTAQIDSSGTGALIVTSLNHTGSGAKTFGLRGYNMDFNEVTANLVDNGGALTVTKSDGGTWVLSGNNTFTGNLNINSGFIGATSGAALGSAVTGSIVFSNGGLFAHNGAITVARNVIIANNTAAVFAGDHSITLNGTVSKASGNNPVTITNSITGGTLTINGNFINLETTNTQTLAMRGTGHTIWNGVIQNSSGAGLTVLDINFHSDASLTLGGVSPNTHTGGTTLTQGKLIINKAGALGGGNFNFNGGVLEAAIPLTSAGSTAIANNVVFGSGNVSIVTGTNSIEFDGTVTNSGGDRRLQNDLTGGATLTLDGTVNLTNDATSRTMLFEGSGNTIINGVIQNGGTATGSALHMRGTGTLTITNQATYGGATTVSNGTLILSGANGRLGGNTTAAVAINSKGTVTLDNSAGNPTTANRLNGKPITLNGGALNLITAAGGSSETMGALTVNGVIGSLGISGAGAGTMTFASINYANTGSMLDLGGIANLGTTNKVIFTTSTGLGLSNNISTRTAIGGKDFATYDAVNGVVAFTGYNVSNNLNTAAATDTMKVTANANLDFSGTLNALLINGNALTVSATDGMRLTLTSGGVLVTGGTNTIEADYLVMGTNSVFQIDSGATLDLKASMTGTTGVAKALDGTLILSAKQYYASTTNVMGGVVRLNAGLNTLFQNQLVNLGAVGLLDLNGNTQFIGQINGSGAQPNSSGSITNSSGTHAVLASNFAAGSGVIGGAITGNLSFSRSGGNTFTMEVANTYTGATLLNGGTTTLRDFATLQNTTAIDINYATLFLANNDNLQIAIDDRINDAAAITLRGGTLTYTGRANDAGSERFGALTVAEGANTISANTGASQAYHSAVVTFSSINRLAGATVNFTGTTLGLGGDGNAGHIFFDNVPTMAANGALGAWAIANSTDYAAYNTTLGVGAFGSASYPIYDTTFGSGKVTNLGGTATAAISTNLSADTVTSLLRFAGAFNNHITFSAPSTKLNLEMGGILRSNNLALTRIGTAASRGVLTAGGNASTGNTELVIYNNNTTNFTGAAANATIANTATLALTSSTGIVPGMMVTGPNVPVGTVVVAVSGNNITLSNNATATANGGTFVFYSTVEVNSVIADTSTAIGSGSATVSLVKSGGGALILTAQNTYTGGTIVNQGQLLLMGSAGTVVIPWGGLTLNSSTVSMVANAGQINSANVVTLNGSSTLNLVGNNTLASLVFNNNGGTGTPTVNTNGVLTLTDSTPITATSTNVATTATINGTVDVGSGVKTFNIDGIKPFGQTVSTISPTLNITAVIRGTATINKTGDGLLQLSGQSTFTGGLNVLNGGIIVAGNSTPTFLASEDQAVFTGPLGAGTVTMAAGTRLLADNNSRSVTNAITFQGNPIFDNTGVTAVTLALNGPIILPTGNVTVDVIAPSLTVAFGGPVTSSGTITSLIKEGLGTLSLNSNFGPLNTSAVVNRGVLELSANPNTATVDSPLTGSVTLNGGQLSLRSNGGASFNNDVILAAGIRDHQINVGPLTTNTGSTIQMGKLTTTAIDQGLAVVAGSGYNLRFLEKDIATQARFNVTSGSTLTFLTSTNGLSQTVTGPGNIVSGGDTLMNIGAGTLVVGVGVKTNTTTNFGGGPLNFAAGSNTFIPLAGTFSSAGYTKGGLMVRQTSFAAAQSLNSAAASGVGPSAAFPVLVPPADTNYNNRPPVGVTGSLTNSSVTYSGLMEITTAGTYGFRFADDDQAALFIDGVLVLADNVGTGGQAITERGTIYLDLTAGMHQIVFMGMNQGSGGGFNLLYSGPDTAGNGSPNGFQALDPNKLYYATGLGSAANNFLNAAIISDTYNLAAGQSSTLDGQGTQFNLMFGNLTLGAGSTLTVQNQFGTGYYGVVGTTTIGGANTIVNPTTGTLYLAGGVVDNNHGLIKNGNGSLYLGTSTNFTGTFSMNAGFTLLAGANGLSSGTNIVASGAQLDLYGNSSHGSVTLNGAGATALAAGTTAALWNSLAGSTGTLTGNVTIGSTGTRIGGIGDIVLSGDLSDGGFGFTKIGTNTLTLSGANAGLTGVASVNNGILKLGSDTALGAGGAAGNNTVVSGGAVLDLNGRTIANEFLSVAGSGFNNRSTSPNTLAAIINSSNTMATFGGPITMTAATSIGSNRLNANSGVATAGDITLSGAVTGAFALTKVGNNTLFVTGGGNTYNGMVINGGKVVVSGAGQLGTGGNHSIAGYGQPTGIIPATTLQLDNTGTASNSRLGGRALSIRNGHLIIDGNATTAVNEDLGTNNLTISLGHNVITLNNNGADVTLSVNQLIRDGSATLVIRGSDNDIGSSTTRLLVTSTAANPIIPVGTENTTAQFNETETSGILPWILIDNGIGTTGLGPFTMSFARYDATLGLTNIESYALELPTTGTANGTGDVNLGVGSDLVLENALSTNDINLQSTGVNSITFTDSPSDLTITLENFQILTLDSGGILALSSANFTGAGSLNVAGNRQFVIHTIGASTVLNADVELGGRLAPTTGGLAKTGEGTLILGERNNYTGSTVVNLGTLKLDGGDNTIFYAFTLAPTATTPNGTPQGQAFAVAPGGIVDLNGHDQTINNIQGNGGQNVAGAGGIVTNTSATTSEFRLVVNGNNNWQGSINGNINLIKSGGSTTAFYDNNAYTGTTLVQGGVLTLIDQGRLSGTSGITVSRAVLRWDDSGMQQVTNRLGAATPITLNGGALSYIARAGTNGVMDVGSIHLAGGANYINATPNAGTATIRMDGLTRTANSTITFAGGTGTPGANPFFYFNSAPTLTNGIIGGWAYALGTDTITTAGNIEFATYDASTGVRMLTAAQVVNHFNDPTGNVRLGASGTVKAGGAVINSLTLNGAALTLSFAAGNDVLNITSGGLLGGLDNNARTIGSIATPGILTAGGVNPASDVYLYVTNASNNMQINSIIADNPTNGRKLHLVLGSAGRNDNTARITLANANTYTGITYIQGVRVDLANTTGSGNAITGDLILSGGIENQADSSNPDAVRLLNRAHNQIADTSNVTILGGGAWELFGFNETINNLAFQNEGGSRNNSGPRVQTGTGTLTLNGNITATNLTNASAVALVAGNVNFGVDNAITVTVDKVAGASNGSHNQIGLALNINVVGGGTMTKLGDGMLALGGQSNSVLQLNVAAGDLTLLSTASYQNTTVNLASGTRLDMRGTTNVVLGNLTGSGTLYNFNVNTTGNLITGGANTNATFDGLISSEFTSGMISVTKVGTGTWTLTADNSQQLANTLVLLEGTILLNSATARLGFATQNISTGGVLTLDNSTNALNFRLGGPIAENSTGIRTSPLVIGSANVNMTIPTGDPNINRNVNMQGGTINLIGGNTNVMEALNQLAMTGGASTINITASSSAETVFITNTLAGVNNGILYLNAVGTGAILGGTKGAGHVNLAATTPNLIANGNGAAGTTNMNIRPDIIGTDSTGTGFVTHDANGLRLLTASEYKAPDSRYLGNAAPVRVTTVAGAPAGTNVATSDNVRTNLKHNVDNNTSVNSLTLQAGGGVESSAGGMLTGSGQGQSVEGTLFNGSGVLSTLQITSGGLLAFEGNTGISGGAVTAVGNRLYVTALGDLNFDAYILGTQTLVKSGAGTMTLGKRTLNGPGANAAILSVNEGRLVLDGGDNTILVASGVGTAMQYDLNINGGTLDLNGNDQAFGRVTTTSGDTTPNGAGDITNTGSLSTFFVNTGAGSVTYSGNISGAINLVKAGGNTWALTGTHSYTGATIVRGGTLQLRDEAVLSGTSSIELNYSSLLVDNAQWQGTSRLPTGVNVTLRGGVFQFTPRQGSSTETIGTLTFQEGLSRTQFNAPALGGGFTVNATSLVRGSGDSTWFATSGIGVLGRGNSDNGDQSPQLIFANGVPLINGIIGGWAIHNGDNWLTYQSTVHASGGTGVGVISDTGAGFIGYDEDTATVANFSSADSIATRNMRIQNGTYTVADMGGAGVSGNFLLNSLAFLTNANGNNLVFADNPDVLYLTAGAFLRSGNFTSSIGSAVDNGRITAGAVGATGLQYLYMFNNQNSLTLNSRIVDNSATAAVRLVLWSGTNNGNFILANGNNTYTGGTVVQGTTNVTTARLDVTNAVPAGGLTINDTNVVMNTTNNVVNGVHASNVVTINGGGILNLTTNVAATNTLAGLVFNNTGGTTTPQVQLGVSGSTLILTDINAITATNLNYQTLPTIAVTTAGNLQFSAAAPVITVNNPSGIATHGLLINAVIQSNGTWTQALTKDGNGMLSLAAANTFGQGVLLKDGGIVLGNGAALGTGTLTVGDGAAGGTHTLMTNGVAQTFSNAIVLNEDLIIGGSGAGTVIVSGTTTGAAVHNLTASGTVALGTANRVITVESPSVVFTMSGVVSSAGGGLVKDGDGILQLNNALNNYTGDTRVKRGLLRQGGSNVLANSNLIVESAGTVDLNSNPLTVKSLGGEDGLHGGVITNSGNNTQTLTVGDASASLDTTFAGIITDNRAVQTSSRINFVKTGDSRQKLTGMNTYGGTTTVNSATSGLGAGGHLQVGENGIGQTGTGVTAVNAGATLSGSGLINGTPSSTNHTLAAGATLSPGDNYGAQNGTLTFNGNLGLAAGSQTVLQLTSRTAWISSIGNGTYVNAFTSLGAELTTLNNTAIPDDAHDALQINGTLSATGGNATSLFLVQDNNYVLSANAGDVFDLIDWVSINLTTFNAGTNFRSGGTGGGDLFLPTLVNPALFWDVSAFASHGLLVVVPEPSRAMLLFGGFLLLLSIRRRRSW